MTERYLLTHPIQTDAATVRAVVISRPTSRDRKIIQEAVADEEQRAGARLGDIARSRIMIGQLTDLPSAVIRQAHTTDLRRLTELCTAAFVREGLG